MSLPAGLFVSRDADKDIDLGSGVWRGAVTDGTTIWAIEFTTQKGCAWEAASLDRAAAKDININSLVGGGSWHGAVSDGTTIWFVDAGGHARAVIISPRSRSHARDIVLGSGSWTGGASDGTTIWFVNQTTGVAVAYSSSTRLRDADKDIDLGSGAPRRWRGGASDGTTLWFIDDEADYAQAITSSGLRDSSRNIYLHSGIWDGGVAVGKTIWMLNSSRSSLLAFALLDSPVYEGDTFGFGADNTGFDQAPFQPLPDPVPRDDFAAPFDLRTGSDRLIHQYDRADTLRELISQRLDLLQSSIITPLSKLERMMNIDLADGIWLDRIGERLGFPRPIGDWVVGGYETFGFGPDDTGFDQAPFNSVTPYRWYRPAISDDLYRALLHGRARTLRFAPTRANLIETVRAVLGEDAIFGVVEGDLQVQIHVVDHREEYLVSLLRQPAILRSVLPVQASVEVQILQISGGSN